jgi:putative FmdB family regulatory protein
MYALLTPYPLPCSLDLVPTYEYECNKCRRTFEVRQRISEPALTTHEGCGGEVHRLISPAPFILKGEGWYVTDYPSEARKKAKEAEKSTTSSTSGNGGDKGADKTSSTTTPSAPASTPAPKTD